MPYTTMLVGETVNRGMRGIEEKQSAPELEEQVSQLAASSTVSAMARQLSDGRMIEARRFPNKPAILENGPLRFVITDSPSDHNIENHLQDLKKLKVKHVCRASEPTYSTKPLISSGITVHELAFRDGDPPPEKVLQNWLSLVEECFIKQGRKQVGAAPSSAQAVTPTSHLDNDERISVHCVAGLGRAPVLVAVALVEYCKLDPISAVNFIRKHRRGAINTKQLKWLEEYVPRHHGVFSSCSCVIC